MRAARAHLLHRLGAVVAGHGRCVRGAHGSGVRTWGLRLGYCARPHGRRVAGDVPRADLRRRCRPLVAQGLRGGGRRSSRRGVHRNRRGGQLRGHTRLGAGGRDRDGPIHARSARLAPRPGREASSGGRDIALWRGDRCRVHSGSRHCGGSLGRRKPRNADGHKRGHVCVVGDAACSSRFRSSAHGGRRQAENVTATGRARWSFCHCTDPRIADGAVGLDWGALPGSTLQRGGAALHHRRAWLW